MNNSNPAEDTFVARQLLRRVLRTLASLLLAGAAVLLPIVLFRQGLLPLIDSVFQPGPEWLSVIRRTGIFVSAIAGYWAYVRWRERRNVSELRVEPVPILLGGASGAALVALPILLLFAIGAYQPVLFRGASPALLGIAIFIIIAATLEELVYRCVLFRLMERDWGLNVALVAQAVIFAVGHLENVERGHLGDAAAMLTSTIVMGVLWAGIYVLSRNLWVVTANHAAWNFTILLCGVPLSGIEDWRKLAPLESRYAGPDWLTGGMFGPESSVLVVAATLIALVWVMREVWRRQSSAAPAGSQTL
jgi:membrane protease YdiL (CAAX protease family)